MKVVENIIFLMIKWYCIWSEFTIFAITDSQCVQMASIIMYLDELATDAVESFITGEGDVTASHWFGGRRVLN